MVTGANGQLGMEFRTLSSIEPHLHFTFVTKEMLSIHDFDAISAYFKHHSFDVCINCAAYTAVDKAESERELAMLINARAVENLAAICKQYNTQFIHFSTDYVFNGRGTSPYLETDTTDPVNYYGETKLLGELAAIQNNAESIVIRTSWVYSSFGNNFVKTMLRLMAERSSIGVVNDQWGCPTYAADLAQAVLQIIQQPSPLPGIYHYCNEGIINWYEFASTIATFINSNCVVQPIVSSAYPTPALRPAYSVLNTKKIQHQFQLIIPTWKESLRVCLNQIQGQ